MANVKPFIVAELSSNHMGDLRRALSMIDAAAKAGADAVKIQTFTPEQMVGEDVVIEAGPWAGRRALDLYRECHTPRDWYPKLLSQAAGNGIVLFSSVFHPDDVAFLETMFCPIYKISSFEATDLDLIECAADTGKPLIISVGMCTWEQIEAAVHAAKYGGCMDLTILKCTSAYPTPLNECNLATLTSLQRDLDVDVGLSDHTQGWVPAVVATALGSTVIEKHFTLSRMAGGADADFSLQPAEFREMVKACREAAESLGRSHYGPGPSEMASLQLRRKPGGKRGG